MEFMQFAGHSDIHVAMRYQEAVNPGSESSRNACQRWRMPCRQKPRHVQEVRSPETNPPAPELGDQIALDLRRPVFL